MRNVTLCIKLAIILISLPGCASQKAQDLDIIWHDGECMLVADGMTIEQADRLVREWTFEKCNINVGSEGDSD